MNVEMGVAYDNGSWDIVDERPHVGHTPIGVTQTSAFQSLIDATFRGRRIGQ